MTVASAGGSGKKKSKSLKLEDDEPSQFVKQDKVEAFMVNVLMTNEFEPAPAEHLLAAFRIMDP